MTTYTDRIVLLFPIPSHHGKPARPAAASLQMLEVSESGREFENLVPLDVAAVGDYANQFSLPLTAERDLLKVDLAKMTAERDTYKTQVDTIPDLQSQITSLTTNKAALQAEVDRLTALVPPPVPDAFLEADWPRFRNLILSDEAVQRVATGNPTAWPLMVLYLAQLSSTPSRGADIAQLWTMLEQNTPITPDEVARINAIATECGVPLQMHDDGSIG